jgi:hypothetical protein
MASFEIRTSTALSILIIIAGLLIGGLILLFGLANLIHPDVPDEYLKQNTIICISFCILGVLALLPAIAAFRGILHRKRRQAD